MSRREIVLIVCFALYFLSHAIPFVENPVGFPGFYFLLYEPFRFVKWLLSFLVMGIVGGGAKGAMLAPLEVITGWEKGRLIIPCGFISFLFPLGWISSFFQKEEWSKLFSTLVVLLAIVSWVALYFESLKPLVGFYVWTGAVLLLFLASVEKFWT
jgi:hypothetical protein